MLLLEPPQRRFAAHLWDASRSSPRYGPSGRAGWHPAARRGKSVWHEQQVDMGSACTEFTYTFNP